jgi:hypothetical protein
MAKIKTTPKTNKKPLPNERREQKEIKKLLDDYLGKEKKSRRRKTRS